MILKIFKAADAFLYLPTYVAEYYGIFDTLLKTLGVSKVEFITTEGDIEAIELMIAENNNANDSIAIAIGDPTAFLSKFIKNVDIEQVRVIGAIINKLPFWAVNHIDRVFSSINEFEKEFTTVIHYKSNLLTGFYLGSKVKKEAKIKKFQDVFFGDEIPALINFNKNKTQGNRAVAITADIISLVKANLDPVEKLNINYKFSQEGNYITTGLLTSKKCCDNNSIILSKIIEAVQKSISMLYSSEKFAINICETISKRSEFNSHKLNSQEIIRIIELITEEKFYPADLNISEESWNNAILALARTEHWNRSEEEDSLRNTFRKYVDNRFILLSEWSIARQFGITLYTFTRDIINKPLYAIAYYLTKWFEIFYKWLFNSSLKFFIIIILMVLTVASGYKWFYDGNNLLYSITFTLSSSILASILAAYIFDLRKRKDG